MKFIYRYAKPMLGSIITVLFLKTLGTFVELLIPYVLEYIIDEVAYENSIPKILLWGALMILLALLVRAINVYANRKAVANATESILVIRRDLFDKTMNLSGGLFDSFGLPSLTSRMTSDSYNIQNFIRSFQTLGIRAPILLIGGIVVTLTMDAGLASILCILAPVMIVLVVLISYKGIPLYEKVQQKVDDIVRVMRENINGVRVVKALSKEEHETKRFHEANDAMTSADMKASIVMSLPGPCMQLFLNCGLTLVVYWGAIRVNDGVTKPGVILAFLTYFNMVLMGVMGINRLFMMMSKANASANRIGAAIDAVETLNVLDPSEARECKRDGFIVFDHVTFGYSKVKDDNELIAGGKRRKAVTDIDFTMQKGGSLGIIGATGSGKTTVFNLLTRFYDVDDGGVFIDGRDVRTFEKDDLHARFGVVFQNDVLLTGTIKDNIVFGREYDESKLREAAVHAGAWEFISKYEDSFDHEVTKLGSNLSGGQKQRILIARALYGDPEILLFDDSSSALDYKTDSEIRSAVRKFYPNVTMLVVAQRVSALMSCDEILMMDDGCIVGRGSHEELMKTCDAYREIYDNQMGE